MGKISIRSIKSIVAHSIIHKLVIEFRTKTAARRIRKVNIKKKGCAIYILSPYKTGTTYIGSLWDNDISKHEPFQLYSLRDMKSQFVENFCKREGLLDLKIECSGFLSLFLDQLPESTIPYKYIYVLRPPSKWVTSVITHFYGLRTIGYNYINEYYWKPLLSYDMLPVLDKAEDEGLQKLIDDLYSVYFKLLNDAINRQEIFFVELKNVDKFAIRLGEKIGIKPDFSKSWKREARYQLDFKIPLNPVMDERYSLFLENLPKERFFPLESTPPDSDSEV